MRTRLGTFAAASATAFTLAVVPASASSGGFDDPRGDVRNSNDIVHVGVSNEDRVVVETTHRRLNDSAKSLFVFIDTRPGRFGPEYVASMEYERPDTTFFSHVNGWRTGSGTRDTNQCRRANASVRGDVTRIAFPSRCLMGRGTIRVAAVVYYRTRAGHASDWAPDFRTFGPTVTR
jgi:hypothetical protein